MNIDSCDLWSGGEGRVYKPTESLQDEIRGNHRHRTSVDTLHSMWLTLQGIDPLQPAYFYRL